MAKAYSVFLKLFSARAMCMLMLVLSVSILGACTEETTPNSDAGDVAAIEQTMKNCVMCSLFDILYNAANSMTNTIVPEVARSVVPVVCIGYGLWLAIFILKYVASLKEPDVSAFWKALGVQTFWLTMGVALLRALASGGGGSAVTTYAEPVFKSFVDVGMQTISATGGDIPCSGGGDPGVSLKCLVKALQEKLSFSSGISLVAIYFGFQLGVGPYLILIGAVIWVVSIIMSIWFPLLLLDGVYRYGIALCMLPLGVAAYIFEVTRKFTGKVAILFVEIGFFVMGMCAFSACCVQIMGAYIDRFLPFIRNPLFFINNIDGLLQVLCGPGMIGFLFLSFFLILFADVLGDFMNALSGGAGGLGSGVQATKGGLQTIAQAPGNIARMGKFVANRGKRLKDAAQRRKARRAAKTMEKHSGAKPGSRQSKKYDKAQNYLKKKGYLDQGGKKTEAFNSLKKTEVKGRFAVTRAARRIGTGIKGVSNYAKGLREDLDNAKNFSPMDSFVDGAASLQTSSSSVGGISDASPSSGGSSGGKASGSGGGGASKS